MHSYVEAVRTCNFILSKNIILVLQKNFYIPKFSKNLISVSKLAHLGLSIHFKDSGFTLANKYGIVGYAEMGDGLYFINLQNDVIYNSMHVTSLKHIVNENPQCYDTDD